MSAGKTILCDDRRPCILVVVPPYTLSQRATVCRADLSYCKSCTLRPRSTSTSSRRCWLNTGERTNTAESCSGDESVAEQRTKREGVDTESVHNVMSSAGK
ncbi:hypothetical protein TNCV_1258451 [Trichonephila clavipes]|nr:hypothetical protein TNCV_1258451 [Trichonephila clavipes]